MEFNLQRSFLMLPVVINANVLVADVLNGKKGGENGDGSGFVRNITVESELRIQS